MTLQCQEKGKTFRVLTSWQRSWQAAQSVIQVEMCKERLTNILQERHFILKVPSNYIKKHVGWKSEFPKCVSEKTVKILHRTPQWGWNCCVKLFVTFFNDWPSKTWSCFWWFFLNIHEFTDPKWVLLNAPQGLQSYFELSEGKQRYNGQGNEINQPINNNIVVCFP